MPYIQYPSESSSSSPLNSFDCYVVIFRPTGAITFNSYTCYFSLRTAKALISRFVGCDPSLKTKPKYSITRYNPETQQNPDRGPFNKETFTAALAAGVYRTPSSSNVGGSGFSHFAKPVSGRGFCWLARGHSGYNYISAREDFIIAPARISLELNPSAFNEPVNDGPRLPPIRT